MDRSAIRNLLIRVASPLGSFFAEAPKRRIIALHDIPQNHEALFVEKIEWLKKHCNIVSLADLAEKRGLDPQKLNIALSFDDGFKEYAHFVAETLTRMNIPATFFTPSGAIGISGNEAKRFSKEGLKRSISFEFMTTEELKALSENPLFAVGGHTTHHRDVATLDEKGRQEEIAEDKLALEAITGKPVEWFAYPFGGIVNINREAIQTIDKSGYGHAFSILPSFWKKSDYKFLVGRDSMSVADPIPLWDAWLSGGYDLFISLKNGAKKKRLLASLS